MKFHRPLLTLVACIALAGCLLPEQFTASITVKPDGSYTYKYDGTAVNVMAASVIQEKGALSPQDEEGLKREAEGVSGSPGVKKFKYTGDGRYDIVIEEELKFRQANRVLQIFTVEKDQNGVYSIEASVMAAQDRDLLKPLNIKVNGKANVYLPANAHVVSTNASSTPGMFSKSYGWRVGSFEERPAIRFFLKP